MNTNTNTKKRCSVVCALLLSAAACGTDASNSIDETASVDSIDETASVDSTDEPSGGDFAPSIEIVATAELLHGRLSGAVYDSLPKSLNEFAPTSGEDTLSSRIVVGEVVEIRPDKAYIEVGEATLFDREVGEKTVLDELPEDQAAELIALIEGGELPPPIEVDFDSPLASWRTVQVVIEVESEITAAGAMESEGQVLAGVSMSASTELTALDGYKKLGRSAFFLGDSPVFQGAEGIKMDGTLVATLTDSGEVSALPFLEEEFAEAWIEDGPSLDTLAEATVRN